MLVPRALQQHPLLFLTLLAFALRLLPALLPFEFSGPDTATYLEPARNLAEGLGYSEADGRPSLVRPPGYPAFLALIFALSGSPSLVAVRLVQALLGALCVPLVHAALARRAGGRLALGGAALTALDPIAIGQAPFVLRELLLLVLLAALLAILARGPRRLRLPLAALLLLALAVTHQLYILLGPFLVLGELCAARRRRLRHLVRWGAAGLLVALGVFLWARRNERIVGQLSFTLAPNAVPARELWLTSIYSNAWLSGDLDTGFQAMAWAEESALMARLGLDGTKAELYRRAWANLRDHPARTTARVLRLNFWYWAEVPGAVRIAGHPRLAPARWVLLPFQWVRLVCVGAALLLLARSGAWRRYRYELATLGFFLLAPALLYPVPRYLAPACPLLDLLAVLGLGASLRARAPARAPELP